MNQLRRAWAIAVMIASMVSLTPCQNVDDQTPSEVTRFYNVIVVHYKTESYILEVPKTAEKIARFIESLERLTGANRHHVTLLGISLGAHVAGQVGRQHTVGRIIGIDPSGPIYDWRISEKRLDASDAEFVDVIHTSKVYGSFRKVVGHVNYVINGGFGQPNCEPLDFYCHHVRGAFLFLASITNCHIEFRQCFSYWAFKLGFCKSWPTIDFGLSLDYHNAPKDGGLYYYDTPRNTFPFCAVEEEAFPKLHPLFC